MNKNIYALLTFFIFIGCTDKDDGFVNNGASGSHTFFAKIEQEKASISRTIVNDDNTVSWEQTDKVGVYGNATSNAVFTCNQISENGATFIGDMDKVGDEITFVYYPYQESAVLNDNCLSFELPAEYNYSGNSNAPMVGVKDGKTDYLFKHTCGLIRFTLGSLPVDADRFVIASSDEDESAIAGNAMIDDVMKSDATLRIVGRGSKTITYNLDDIATGTSLRHFFVPLPVGTYKNLDVSLYGKGKNEPYFTRSISDVTVLRASIVSVPIINGQTGGEYLLSSNTVEVTDEIATNVRVAETDRHTLRYNKNIASENLPEVGEIVISRPHSTIPSGFLGKVIKTSTLEDGSCEVATESVPFTEAFERLYVDKSFELVPEEMDNEGTMTRDKNADTEYSNDVSRFFYSGIAHVNDNNTIHAHGSVRIGAVVSMNFIIDKEQNVNVMKYEIISFSDTDVSLKVETDDYPLFVEYNQQELPFKLQEWEADTVLLADGLLPIFTNVTPTFSIKSRGCLNFNVKLDEETSFRRFTENVGSGWTSYYITGPGGYPEDSFKKKQWTLDKLDEETCFKNYETGEADDYAMIASTVGVSAKIMAYNSDNYSTSINSHITNSLTGGLTLGDNKSLKDSKFTTKTSVGGTFNIKQIEDSKTDTEADLDTVNYTIPFTRNDSSDVQKLIPPEFPLEYKANRYRPSQEGEQGFNASVWAKTKRGILDMEDYKFNIVLMNEKDEEIAVSPDFSYDDKDIECEINHVFENLQEDRKYKAYVRVAHPFLNALVEKNPDAYDHTDGAINMLEDTLLILSHQRILFGTWDRAEATSNCDDGSARIHVDRLILRKDSTYVFYYNLPKYYCGRNCFLHDYQEIKGTYCIEKWGTDTLYNYVEDLDMMTLEDYGIITLTPTDIITINLCSQEFDHSPTRDIYTKQNTFKFNIKPLREEYKLYDFSSNLGADIVCIGIGTHFSKRYSENYIDRGNIPNTELYPYILFDYSPH